MRYIGWVGAALMVLAQAAAVTAQPDEPRGEGRAIVTVLPRRSGEVPASVANQDLAVKVNGKPAKVTRWVPAESSGGNVELVVLIDNGARPSLGTQIDEIAGFVRRLPPNVKASIAYMQNGRAVLGTPLSADHAKVLSGLHMPSGPPGISGSPYFCLSDLAKNWPSHDTQARRITVMITDGVDNYERRYDPEDPYVGAAIQDAVKAHLLVYSIYWKNRGLADQSWYENYAGQNLLVEVAQATGGKSFWEGTGDPVTFEPYFDELTRRLRNQYELRFTADLKGKPEVESFRLKLSAPGAEVDSPGEVYVTPVAR